MPRNKWYARIKGSVHDRSAGGHGFNLYNAECLASGDGGQRKQIHGMVEGNNTVVLNLTTEDDLITKIHLGCEFLKSRSKRTVTDNEKLSPYFAHRSNQVFEAFVIDQAPHTEDQSIAILLPQRSDRGGVACLELFERDPIRDHTASVVVTGQRGRRAAIVRRGCNNGRAAAESSLQERLERSAENPLAHDVAVISDHQPTTMSTREIRENCHWVRQMEMDDFSAGIPDLDNHPRANGRGSQSEQGPHACDRDAIQ